MNSGNPIDRILGRGRPLDEEAPARAFVDSGGRPQMGFFIAQLDGTMDGFLYHSLDNIRLQSRNGSDFLSFTHRGTAVTIQGTHLRMIFKAMMRHTLMEIHERDDAEQQPGLPMIERLEVTPPERPGPSLRLAK